MKNKLPRLNFFEPIISKVVLGFGIFNLVVGAGLYLLAARTLNFFIINDVFTEQFWGSLFFINGIILLLAFWANNWKVMRMGLLAGFTLKLFWLLALVVRQIEDFDTNIFLLLFFSMTAYLQLVAYIHFPDKRKVSKWTPAG